MKTIDEAAIRDRAAVRFRSEYDYAQFEYYRSAKVIRYLEAAGVPIGGRILDDGCGGGGMPLSFAEESTLAVGIDLSDRFSRAGLRLAGERGISNVRFVRADGLALPFGSATFDLILSHSVIEHVRSAEGYLAECRRLLTPGGRLYLETGPYLSLAGAHLPRLLIPVPLHLLIGRSLAFRTFRYLARRAPWLLREQRDANTFILMAERGELKDDDLLQHITVSRLRRLIRAAGLTVVREGLTPSGFFQRRVPAPLRRALMALPGVRDVTLASIQYILAAGHPAEDL